MARMRSLRPDFFLREDMADVSLEAHFLLGGLAVLADRDGRLLDRPRTIKAQVSPFRDIDVEKALGELVAAGVVARYSAGGKAVLALLTWEEDQTPHPKETSLGLPPPPVNYSPTVAFQATPQPSRKVHDGSGNDGDGSGRVHVGLGLGLGVGIGCGFGMGVGSLPSEETASPTAAVAASAPEDDIPQAHPDDVHAEDDERPPLVLVPQPVAKPTRKQSVGEALYARLEDRREKACTEDGVPFVPSRWPFSRQNRDLGPIARAETDAPAEFERFRAAWLEFVSDPATRDLDVPYSLDWFWKCRSRYEGKALRGEG
jgi:hypothetical protein